MYLTRSNRFAVRGLAALAGTFLALGVSALPASADHAGEKLVASKTADLTDGETVTVTFSGFAAGAKPAKVVIAGQGELTTIPDKLNFDEYGSAPTATVAPDGTGSLELVATADHGTMQDGTTLDCKIQQCWIIVVQEPFLPQPNYASVPITFAGGSVAAATTAAPETTAAPATTVAPVETVPVETTTTAVALTTTTEPATTTTVAAVDTASDDEDSGGSGALYAIIAAVVVVLGGAGFFIAKRKPPVG